MLSLGQPSFFFSISYLSSVWNGGNINASFRKEGKTFPKRQNLENFTQLRNSRIHEKNYSALSFL